MAGGRPSKYKPEYADLAYKFTLLGADDEGLAELFEVSTVTVNSWKKNHPEFLKALKDGKGKADAEVADRLYKRATGYEYMEQQATKIKHVKYDNGKRLSEDEEVVITDVLKIVPPDATSIIFWLKNRQRQHWRDRYDHKQFGTVKHQYEEMTDDQIDRAIATLKEGRAPKAP